ncbi:hypothetical protein [Nodosilinea sp. E11]|uniref:hypothetical protein n=1 Tax=Nodosilinea sp. E11 TaxID=3037479 RepID=UPI002935087B|nr:hypothetical protein [Nodosilinea sp. E11]WOD41360.1 hypothetical protein RRF56_11200 [Nodosilinea sp. E11]
MLSADQLQALAAAFSVTPAGNFEGQIVLQRTDPGPLSGEVEAALDQLFTLRYGTPSAELSTFHPAPDNQAAKTQTGPGRIPPVTDTKLIVAWLVHCGGAAVMGDRAIYLPPNDTLPPIP